MFRKICIVFGLYIMLASLNSVKAETPTYKLMRECMEESMLLIAAQVEKMADETLKSSRSAHLCIGPILTKGESGEYYQSQFGQFMQDHLPIRMTRIDFDYNLTVIDSGILPRKMKDWGIDDFTRLNTARLKSAYESEEDIRQCLNALLRAADFLVLGEINLAGDDLQMQFALCTVRDGRLYVESTPLRILVLPTIKAIALDKKAFF